MEKAKYSFSSKILLYAASVSILSLTIVGLSFISYDIKETRKSLVEAVSLQADMIGTFATTTLISKNSETAQEIIDQIGVNKHIVGAWIYLPDGKIFAKYDPLNIGANKILEKFIKEGCRRIALDAEVARLQSPIPDSSSSKIEKEYGESIHGI